MTKYIIHSVAGAKRVKIKNVVSAHTLKDVINYVKKINRGAWNLKIVKVEKMSDNYLYRPTDKRYKPKDECLTLLKYHEE